MDRQDVKEMDVKSPYPLAHRMTGKELAEWAMHNPDWWVSIEAAVDGTYRLILSNDGVRTDLAFTEQVRRYNNTPIIGRMARKVI